MPSLPSTQRRVPPGHGTKSSILYLHSPTVRPKDIVRLSGYPLIQDSLRRHYILRKTTTTERGFLSYLYADVSVLTAFLFGLPGLGASCWRVAAGSAGRPECLPCKNAMCIWWVKCMKGDPSFWSWDFLVFLTCDAGSSPG